jgi:RNA polymerase sigma-70 factor (ECF subfamily)
MSRWLKGACANVMKSIEDRDGAGNLSTELYARFHRPLMRFFLRRVGSSADAEDLTQETLIRVINASRQHPIENALAFVFQIAVNLLRDRHRKRGRSGSPVFVPIDEAMAAELEQELTEQLSPERFLLGMDTLEDAMHVLNELGPLTRDIFILFRIENMKQKDIAALYGIGQSTVEKHVMKAVAHLGARFGSRKS